eukprot:2249783-Prymnesium_polylepis.1
MQGLDRLSVPRRRGYRPGGGAASRADLHALARSGGRVRQGTAVALDRLRGIGWLVGAGMPAGGLSLTVDPQPQTIPHMRGVGERTESRQCSSSRFGIFACHSAAGVAWSNSCVEQRMSLNAVCLEFLQRGSTWSAFCNLFSGTWQ